MTRLDPKRAALLVVDIQDRLVPAMPEDIAARVIKNAAILIEAAARLKLPIVCSQQYPKGLGVTVAPIEAALAAAPKVFRFDKVEFSAAAAPDFIEHAATLPRNQWIVCGMETHVCVYQTTRDLVDRGAEVHVVADAVSSRTKANWRTGLDLAARDGAVLTSTEVVVFDLLQKAGTDDFKVLSKLIK